VISHPKGIKVGYSPLIWVHTAHVVCRVDSIIKRLKPDEEDGPERLKTG
jgi:translation elongation factor EF-1alpha